MKRIYTLVFMLCVAAQWLAAQRVIITMKDGTQQAFSMSAYPSITFTEGPHDAVDLGLSVLWSPVNLDIVPADKSASTPNTYGSYVGWSDPTGTCTSSSPLDYGGRNENDISGTELDIAHVMWGEGWRLPLEKEFSELKEKCSWRWTSIQGVKGYVITGPNGNTLFLPAAGRRTNDGQFSFVGEYGSYWTGTIHPTMPANAYYMTFYEYYITTTYCARPFGMSVRPVKDKAK